MKEVVDRLARDQAVEAIWIVGSRVNGNVHEKSDWDLLVFDREEKGVVAQLTSGVDVVRVRPSGLTLVDGCSDLVAHDFADWQWERVSETEATYRAKKWTRSWDDDDQEDSDGFDEPPQVVYEARRAVLVWARLVVTRAVPA